MLSTALAFALALVAADAPAPAPAPAPAARAVRAPGGNLELIACAPGWPGTTEEAQRSMDGLVSAVARSAGLPGGTFSGVYLPDEQDGLARLARPEAGVALVPLPFFAKHAAALELEPRLEVVTEGSEPSADVWTLVAKKGRVTSPAALAGLTLLSSAGYAPGFVRGILSSWGELPADVPIVPSSQVLSALRKAASGADVVVLLDGPQSRSLSSLPFAGELEVVARSTPVPAGLIVTVGRRLGPERWKKLERGFLALPSAADGKEALAGMRTRQFSPLGADARALLRRAAGWVEPRPR